MSSEHPNHGDKSKNNEPPTLLENPAVTIHLDGLIYTLHNHGTKVFQAGIHTGAEHHHLLIKVEVNGDQGSVSPTGELVWDLSHDQVNEVAPLWLYVDSGGGLKGLRGSAELHDPDDGSQRTFKNVFDFEERHNRKLIPNLNSLAIFNFPQGMVYSGDNVDAKMGRLEHDRSSGPGTDVEEISVSTIIAIDINASSEEGQNLVLANDSGKEIFKFKLETGTKYKIKILNVPELGHQDHHDPSQHFLQFYELFNLMGGENKFVVTPLEHPIEDLKMTKDSPPCIGTTGGRSKDGFPKVVN